MNRRSMMDMVCRLFALATAAVVAIPGARFLLAPLSKSSDTSEPEYSRICKLNDLTPGVPKMFPIRGSRQDAWTVYPEETIGQVWAIRRDASDAESGSAKVEVFSAVCPHLGCTIQRDPSGADYVCPCHKAYFDNLGAAFTAEQMGEQLGKGGLVVNPSPRGMDSLESRIVDEAETDQRWVEVAYVKFLPNVAEKIPVS